MAKISAKLISQGLYPAPSTPAQFDAHIRAETARYAKIIKEAGIKADWISHAAPGVNSSSN